MPPEERLPTVKDYLRAEAIRKGLDPWQPTTLSHEQADSASGPYRLRSSSPPFVQKS